MIPRTAATWQGQTWQEQLINVVRDPAELCDLLGLDFIAFSQQFSIQSPNKGHFPLRVPRHFVGRMQAGNLHDPLLLQVMPRPAEEETQPGFITDPLQEDQATKATGLIQKYHGRVLLLVNSACAVHCRYCFRRHFPYGDHRQGRNQWLATLEEVRRDSSIHEVIFSGGDPLAASDHLLSWLAEQIAQIPHVQTLRIHTRLPVVIPDRVDSALLAWLEKTPLNKVMVIHSNHPNELDEDVARAMGQIKQVGVTLLNQAVLLKGINDQCDTLKSLSEKLFQMGVLPYYLHLLDKVAGTHHFDSAEPDALALHNQLKSVLPGYLVPKLAKEIPVELNKIIFG